MTFKQWLFDSPTAPPRLLKFRAGHAAPPHLIRFYGEDGKQLLTAARDRALRCTSVVRDSRSFELSQGKLQRPRKLALADSPSRVAREESNITIYTVDLPEAPARIRVILV